MALWQMLGYALIGPLHFGGISFTSFLPTYAPDASAAFLLSILDPVF